MKFSTEEKLLQHSPCECSLDFCCCCCCCSEGKFSSTMSQSSCSQPCFPCTKFVKQWWVQWNIDYFPIRTSLTSSTFMIWSFQYFLFSKLWVNYIALIFWKNSPEDQAPLICFEDDWRSREVSEMLYISFNVSDWLFSFYKWVDNFVKLKVCSHFVDRVMKWPNISQIINPPFRPSVS